jgi:ATP-binding cassette, subfamily F, member 3
MSASYDGDVYPVDVSTNPNVLTQVRASTIRAMRQIQAVLSNTNIYLSDICYFSQYDPDSLQYMLEFFRHVAQTLPTSSSQLSQGAENAHAEAVPIEPMDRGGSARDMLQDRAGIIVLREDLDFYAIPPKRDIDATEMLEVKRAAARALVNQSGIFSGLRKSEEPGTTEQHLIEMLTAGFVYHHCPLAVD